MRADLRTQHLSDEEFSRLLDGAEPGPAVQLHLATCDFCREELQTVQDSLGDFRSFSTAWAAIEAPRRIPVPARWLEKMQRQRQWGAGLAATAATGLLAFWMGFAPHAHTAANVHALPAIPPTNAELAADNRLLLSIDTELTDQTQPMTSVAAFRLEPRHTARRTAGTLTD